LLAAVFSGGFLASDDHHVVIGAAEQIAGGIGLPSTYERSALFPGVIAGIMTVTRGVGIHDPGVEMVVVRLLQALFSLLVVYFVYRLLERSLGARSAMLGGLLARHSTRMPVTRPCTSSRSRSARYRCSRRSGGATHGKTATTRPPSGARARRCRALERHSSFAFL